MQSIRWVAGLAAVVALCACGSSGDDDMGGALLGAGNGSGGQVAVAGSGGAKPAGGSGGVSTTASNGGGGAAGTGMAGSSGASGAGSGGTTAGAGTGGMSAGSGGMSAGSGGATMMEPTGGTDPTMLPTAPEPCPTLAEGARTVMILGTTVNIWVGKKSETQKAPIYIYWHGTGGNGRRGNTAIGPAADEILAQGGIIAAPNETTKMGTDTCNAVWYTGDFGIADEIVACAIEQLNIDTRRIYTGGASAGGLQSGALAYGRSGYLAAAVPNSGGISPRPGLKTWQDMAHPPAMMTLHGSMGMDVVSGLDFATSSLALDADIVAKGGFAIDCDHANGHVGAPADLMAASWDFLKAHPYGTKPSPYAAGLPANFPSYCTIIE